LENEVKKLELEDKRNRLLSLHQKSARIPDAAEVSGLGPMTEKVRDEVQSRAFQTPQHQEGWLSLLLKNPTALGSAIAGLKGILGVPTDGVHHDGGGLSELLPLLNVLGFRNLRELQDATSAPKAPLGLKVGDISLSGISLTPEILLMLLKREDQKLEFEESGKRQDRLLEGIKGIISNNEVRDLIDLAKSKLGGETGSKRSVATRVGEKAANSAAQGGKSGEGQPERGPVPETGDAREPEQEEFVCPTCKESTFVPLADCLPGSIIKCKNNFRCHVEWKILTEEETIAQEKEAKKKAEEVPLTVSCQGCGQSLSVGSLPLGSRIECPFCHEKTTIISEDEPVEPIVEK
jgi:hypothetical protein